MRGIHILLATLAASGILSGCSSSSITGIGGTPEYGCKAPAGVACQSVSGAYANASQRNLPSQRAEDAAKAAKQQDYKQASAVGATPYSGMPLRSESRVLRVWIAPWEDGDGDLNDQSYSYVVVDSGRWMIDHNRRNIANEYAPARPPIGINATNAKSATKADAKKGTNDAD